MHVFFVPVTRWIFFLSHSIARFFSHTHICPFNSIIPLISFIYLCHSCRAIKLYTSSVMNIYVDKLIYTGAEEVVEVVECTELDLIS